jgi:predicted anti-sigma-YlaC factor YlaD
VRFLRRLRRELRCRAAVALMTDYLEGAMVRRDRARFEGHLAQCSACLAYLDQMEATIAAAGRLRVSSLPEPVLVELVALAKRFSSAAGS